LTERRCILLDVPLTAANDSEAHIIPSALGGRLKPRGILSDAANGELNDKFDLPLVSALAPFMALLGGSRDRGENQPIEMTDRAGNKYRVVFGKPLQPAQPEFSKNEISSGMVTYQISARTFKETRTLFGRIKKDHPNFDIEAAMQRAAVRQWYLDEMIGHRVQIGPIVTFPAAFVMASVYAAHHRLAAYPSFRGYVQGFDPDAPSLPPDTFYWSPPQQWVRADGDTEVSHILALISDAKRRQALFYAELFNLLGVAVVLPYEQPNDICQCQSYGLDVISGKEVSVVVDCQMLRSLDWKPTHRLGEINFIKEMRERMERIMAVAVQRSRYHELSRIAQEVLGPTTGRPRTKDDAQKLTNRITEFLARLLPRGNEQREAL